MSTKISDDSMSLEIDGLTPREAALYGPQATKVAARSWLHSEVRASTGRQLVSLADVLKSQVAITDHHPWWSAWARTSRAARWWPTGAAAGVRCFVVGAGRHGFRLGSLRCHGTGTFADPSQLSAGGVGATS